ncbi:MAG: tetratricopeptide repeat-containing glycosyltransferase family protein [Pirellulaceae bacterium]|nr:tetratricopeptide repeat-containing glycosyltransferase family protein [Pirellulaceae bacterium]
MPTADEFLQSAWKVHQSGGVAQAHQMYRQVIEKIPHHANAWCYLGIALHDLRRYREAIEAYEKAIAINPHFPIAFNNMGNSLRYDYRPEEAEQAFQKALAFDPNYLSAHKNRGTLHAWQGNYDLALESYAQAKKLSPEEAETHRNLGVIYLLKGDFKRGWPEYRWRWKCAEASQVNYLQPKWTGESLSSKTILLYSEQGLGDAIHFIRFAAVLQERGARVIVHGPPALTALLRKCRGIDAYVPNSLPIEQPFDYHCSLLDVADLLSIDDSNIPMPKGYLQPPEYLMGYWKQWLQSNAPMGLRVGLVWQGNRDHMADIFRSFPLKTYERLGKIDGIQFISLQQGYGVEQIKEWTGIKPLIELPEGTDVSSGAFMDTAAIVSQLDLVITSDTSMAHLAGALGRPAWVLLNKMPDWRWLLDRDDSPWYSSLRLFRQSEQGNWADVAAQVELQLKEYVSQAS